MLTEFWIKGGQDEAINLFVLLPGRGLLLWNMVGLALSSSGDRSLSLSSVT